MTAPDEPPETPALAALLALRQSAIRPRAAGELERGLATLRARVAADRPRRPVLVRAVVAGAVAAVVLVALLVLPLRSRTPADAVALARIAGGALLDGGYLAESGHAGIELDFNEGTRFMLRPGARARLRAVDSSGAALSLENGEASFRVTPNPARHWSIEAGPFLVTVKGTVFDVSWDPASERFDLTLRRGRVVVTGPVVGGAIPLRAGQHLAVRLPQAQTVISETAREEAAPAVEPQGEAARGASATSVPAPAGPRPAARQDIAAPPASTARRRDSRGWPALLAAGQWDRVLADADREGVDAAIERAPSEDLFALADAARYRHRPDVARAALLAERRRFPGSPRALDAIFLLGRVAELRDDGARAVALYDEYLARTPSGPFADEALGRKMILAKERGAPADARAIARAYLLRFPAGSYAAAARALTRGP